LRFQTSQQSQDIPVPFIEVHLCEDAAGQLSLQLEPLDDLIAPMVRRLIEPGIFQLQQVLYGVLAKRLAGVQLAFAQILDFLGNVLDIESIGASAAATRPVSGPGVEIVVV